MVESLQSQGRLSQSQTAEAIRVNFGDEFIYRNDNGNPAIDKAILKHFKKATADSAVWSKSGFYWRLREPDDDPNKRQVR